MKTNLVSVITASLKVDYSAVYVKIAIVNTLQNFGQERIIKYGLRQKDVKIIP